jgi:hypothetical protein
MREALAHKTPASLVPPGPRRAVIWTMSTRPFVAINRMNHWEAAPQRRETSSLYSNVAELPWPRRRRPRKETWVKCALKAVVWSPGIVLVVWSLVAVAWRPSRGNARGLPARDVKALPVYGPLGMAAPGDNTIVRPMPGPLARAGQIVQPNNLFPIVTPEDGVYYKYPLQGDSLQYTAQQGTSQEYLAAPVVPAPPAQYAAPVMTQAQFPLQPLGLQLVAPPAGASNIYREMMAVEPQHYDASPLANSQYTPILAQNQPYMGSSSNGYVYAYSGKSSSSTTTTSDASSSSGSTSSGSSTASNTTDTTSATDGSSQVPPPPPHPPVLPLAPPPAGSFFTTKVYYYDPNQAISSDGQLKLPRIVYDPQGNPVPLADLRAAEILVEPPMQMIHHNYTNATIINITYYHPNVESSHRDNKRTMSLSDASWGSSTSTDQSIIVATVGIMALLVGAVSARKLRSRSLLSACIENEDEAAYDTAYTIASENYHTFPGWKGDLEKFDV